MRIVFVNPVGEIGGAERSLLAWMGAVRVAYPDASLILLVPSDGSLANRARALDAGIEVIPMPAALAGVGDSDLRGSRLMTVLRLILRMIIALPVGIGYLRRVRRALRRLRPDLIHSNGLKCHLILRVVAPRGVPIVWHLHDFIGLRPRLTGALRWAAKKASVGVAVSNAVASDFHSALQKLPVQVVYNTTDIEHFSPAIADGADLDKLAGLAPPEATQVVRVVLVATYAHWKGQDVFLEAASRALRPATVPMRFYVVGGPIYSTGGSQFTQMELRAQAVALQLGDHVGFIGFQRDPVGIYRSADIVVHASKRPEPFGLTIIEAMACGRATIAIASGGSGELFTDKEDALGIFPNDPAALAEAILTLAANGDLRLRLGTAARASVVRRFNPNNLPTRVKEVYQTLLDRHADRKT